MTENSDVFDTGDMLLCKRGATNLTEGQHYRVLWNNRPDINFPTVQNDAGHPAQYAGSRFERIRRMTVDECIARLEFALHRWERGRSMMDQDACTSPAHWRDMSERINALGRAMDPRSPSLPGLISQAAGALRCHKRNNNPLVTI